MYNILITTFEYVSDFEYDCLILPQFDVSKQILEEENIFKTLCSIKDNLYIFQKENDYSNELLEIVKL